jgi:hypothetical protein
MPIEAKPLFRASVVAPRVAAFEQPESAEAASKRLSSWVHLVHGPGTDRLTEAELLPDYMTDVFYGLLGYAGPSGGTNHTLSR